MSFTLFYIFISLAIFIVFFYYLFNLWNPDISKFFNNEKIKTFLFDRYWFIKNKKNLNKKNLFIVLSNNNNEYLKELTNQIEEESNYTYFEDAKKVFEIIEIQSSSYLFINEMLLKENKEISLIRLKLNLRNILKLRKNKLLDGVIFFPNQSAFSKFTPNYKELSEEAFLFSKLFKEICSKLKSKIPVFFIDTAVVKDVPPLHLYPLLKDEGESDTTFGFAHKTHENADDLNKELKKAIESCIASYEINSQHYLLNFEGLSQGNIIRFFFNLKSNLISFSKNYIDYFYKGFSLKDKDLTQSHYIINLSSFYKKDEFEDKNSNLFNLFKFISTNLINGSFNSKEFIKSKIRNRYILGALTLLNLTFVSYALYSSSSFLQKKRSIFLNSFSELNNFISGFNKIDKATENFDFMQNKVCGLINNSNKLASTNFYYSLLYPSWNSDIAKTYSEKYNVNLANFVSKILVQNFNEKVSEHILKNKTQNLSSLKSDEIIQKITHFINENKNINNIYTLINTNNPQKNTEAFTQMANFLYGLDCGKTLAERNVFSTIENKNISSLINPNYSDFKQQSNEILKNSLQVFFENYSKNHDVSLAANKVSDDLKIIKDKNRDEESPVDSVLLKKFIADLNNLQDVLLKNQENIKSSNNFYGSIFIILLTELEKNPLFGKEFSNHIVILANQEFEDFKANLSSITPIGAAFPVITSTSGNFTMNPALVQVSLALTKMDATFNTNPSQNSSPTFGTDKKSISSDLKFIAQNLPSNALWEIDALQTNLQKGTIFSSAVTSVNPTLLPEALSLFFSHVAKKMSSIFWNKNLANSLKIFNMNDQLPNPANPQVDPNIQNLQLSAPILRSISDLLISGTNNDINTSLVSIIGQQIDKQAKKQANLLNAMPFYTPLNPDFMNWSGETSPAFKAFGVGTDEDLKIYITNQKSSLEQYFNKNVTPILQARSSFFKDSSFNNDKSLEILLSLQDALSATPKTNSFTNFSAFLTTSMSPLRTEGCSKFIANPPMMGNNDFFSIKLKNIYTPLAKRCQSLLIKQAYVNYDKIATQFNSALSGKFPFTTDAKAVDSASIDDLSSIFNDFSQFQKQDLPILKQYSALYRGRAEIQNFIQGLTDAQIFFNTQADKDGNISPTKWSVDVDFRTNTDREILGNQIINWSLQSGNETIGSDQGNVAKGKFLWTYSDPIQFSVTMAKTTKYSLDKFSEDKNIFITNNTVYFNVRNRWSLLKFINDYADCSNINYCLRNTLKFELPINNDKKVKFFISLYLKNAKGVRVNMPKLPTLAPYIEKKGIKLSTDESVE